ncbi:uncharacterized protein G2W53_025611 [Senna tora]|uniref:Uncharacterized protein n=1 Tax=Senna tora TaxID=362788 RepID=A0A834TFK8_9FABA|nr:uncharacterized protein G2W53_025611 [Senna tora]
MHVPASFITVHFRSNGPHSFSSSQPRTCKSDRLQG